MLSPAGRCGRCARSIFTLMIGLYGIAFWLPTIVKAFGMKGYLRVGLITAIPLWGSGDRDDFSKQSFG